MCRYSGTVYVSARSNGRIDVESILKRVGGGGTYYNGRSTV